MNASQVCWRVSCSWVQRRRRTTGMTTSSARSAFSVEGVLDELHYGNPHVILKIRPHEGQLYTALWERLNGVQRRGGDRTTLTVGERVMVIGSPPRDPASRDIALLREVKRW